MHRRPSAAVLTPYLLLGLIVLGAGALRLYRIDAQSFWNDEGNSARLAERSVHLILEGAEGDIHPPGYYLALHYWRSLFGHSEAALRGLSVLCSLAIVALAFLLARRLFSDVASGLAAAACVAIHPFQVYYAQEARMYAMSALWALVSTWALVEWWQADARLRRARRGLLAAYVLSAAAGLYTHYAFTLVVLSHGLSVGALLWLTRQRSDTGRRLGTWAVAAGLILTLYAPWLPIAWHQVTSWSPPGEPHRLFEAFANTWRLLNFGHTVHTEVVTGGMIAAASCVLLSLLPPTDEQDRISNGMAYRLRWGLLALLVLLPTVLLVGVGLYREAYQKFLLISAAPLSLLVARGVATGWRVASGAGVWGERSAVVGYRAVIVFLAALYLFDTGRSLDNLYFDKAYSRSDYRSIAGHVRAIGRPGDAVILNAPNQWEVFTYYFPDDSHVFPLARQRPFDEAINRSELEQIAAEHRRVFGIFWGDAESDPQRFIEGWLEANTFKASETWYGDVRLAVYAVPAEPADQPSVEFDALFLSQHEAGAIHLEGYTLLGDVVETGDIIQLALYWRAEQPVTERYKVFVHLYDEAGRLAAQTDSEPGATLRPTNTWVPGERVTDRYGVLIAPEVPAGVYTLAVGLYPLNQPDTRLQVLYDDEPASDRLNLAAVEVVVSAVPSHRQD